MTTRPLIAAATAVLFSLPVSAYGAEQCGGTERWPVKMASDPGASQIDSSNIEQAGVAEINSLEPTKAIASDDETSRMSAEDKVYQVHGYLAFYKSEADGDYHIVITDGGTPTKGGRGTLPTGHSIVVEIPDVDCTAGAHGQYSGQSRFADEIAAARTSFENIVGQGHDGKVSPTIPVIVTGVLFFDFDHGQVGRSRVHTDSNGKRLVVELHPVIDIKPDTEAYGHRN